MLALLAFACFPVVAQAETVYETESPTIEGETVKPETSHHKNNSGNESSPEANASGKPPSGSGGQGPGSGNGANNGGTPSTSGGKSPQGSQGNGSPGANGGKQNVGMQEAIPVAETEDSSSSPLVPILIAVIVLAAITIGAVVLRQRRQRGAPVSPKAS